MKMEILQVNNVLNISGLWDFGSQNYPALFLSSLITGFSLGNSMIHLLEPSLFSEAIGAIRAVLPSGWTNSASNL